MMYLEEASAMTELHNGSYTLGLSSGVSSTCDAVLLELCYLLFHSTTFRHVTTTSTWRVVTIPVPHLQSVLRDNSSGIISLEGRSAGFSLPGQ
jgi:hypothetical protein